MRQVNFLNRCTRLLLWLIMTVTQICGITWFYYNPLKGRFRISTTLKLYSYFIILCISSFWFLILVVRLKDFFQGKTTHHLFFEPIVFLSWWHMIVLDCGGMVRQINKILAVEYELSALARNPNVFRLRDLMFLIFAIQNAIRSLCLQGNVIIFLKEDKAFMFMILGISLTYQLQVTINMCLYVVLIAFYNQLHRCTKRISNDVVTLRNSQVLEIGQILNLVEQLKKSTEGVIKIRLKLIGITTELMKIFEFHWLCLLIYGFLHFSAIVDLHQNKYYTLAICTLYLTYNFTVLKVLTFESRTSRSFSHFHLTNYHHGFDATIEDLQLLDVWKPNRISFYGIDLDMKLLLKLLSLACFAFFFTIQSFAHRHLKNTLI